MVTMVQGKMEAARRYLTHTHTGSARQKTAIMQDAATNCKWHAMRCDAISLPCNSRFASPHAGTHGHSMALLTLPWRETEGRARDGGGGGGLV
jgi:hypothetical protein